MITIPLINFFCLSFPGGMKNDQDLSIEAAALREAEEELALDRYSIRILSSLGPFLNRVRSLLLLKFV